MTSLGRHESILQQIANYDVANLASQLTLLTVLLHPVGFWALRPWILALAVAGLVSTTIRHHWSSWLALAMLTGVRVIEDWPMADNHAYLLAYWCLALCLGWGSASPRRVLRANARWMVGLVFAFAVLWKGLLSPDFMNGTFFRVTFLTDDRFANAVELVAGLDENDLEDAREALRPLPPGATLVERRHLPETDTLRQAATISTWATLVLEAVLAVAFLLPLQWLRRWRDLALIGFCLVAYPLAPVYSFGWLLLTLGVSQCEPSRGGTRAAYLTAFLLLIFFREIPWTDLLLDWKG